MKNKLLVLVDLGTFKAFRVEENELHSTPRLDLIEEFETIAGKEKLVNLTTDLAGRYRKGNGPGEGRSDMSDGEQHNIELEMRRRLVRQLADRINTLIAANHFDGCYLAASNEINKSILDELPAQSRAKITKNVSLNLTHLDKSQVLRHFYPQKTG